jgi:hypothetical protein
MGSSVYKKIRFDVYAESDKIYSLDMQNGYTGEMIHNRLVYYACRAVGGQDVKNFEYGKLKMCVVTFIFEKNSYNSNQFLTRYYMAAETDGKIRKYSDLLNVVELNLGYYEVTDNDNLNILCEFLKIQSSDDLKGFYEKHSVSEYGGMLYGKYIKVIMNKDMIERVSNMQLYQDKYQVKYLSENDVKFISESKAEEIAIELLDVLDVETIAIKTNLTVKRVKELKATHGKKK